MNIRNPDPLKRLPYEIWTRTIKFYARDQPEGPLPLLAVSASWERRLLASPEVWTTIYLDGGHDEHARAACFFHLSGTFKVTLVLDRNSGAIDTFIEHRDRVKSLVFMSRLKTLYSSDDVARFSYWLSKHTYTNLLHIHVEPPRDRTVLIPRNLIESCPALIGVHGGFIDQDDIQYLSASTTSLGISGDGMLSDGIGDQLKVMRVRRSKAPLNSTVHPKYFTVPTTQMKEVELSSGEWTGEWKERLIASGLVILPPIMAFVATSHYGLEVLRITLAWPDVNLILSHLSACPALRELELIINMRSDLVRSLPPGEIGKVGHVHKLTISVTPENDFRTDHLDILGAVIRTLTKSDALQGLKELRWNVMFPMPELIDFLYSTKNLRELRLSGLAPMMDYLSQTVTQNHLHTLFLLDLEWLDWLDAPNLLHFECRDQVLFKYPLRNHFFGALKSITIPYNYMYRWNQSLLEENNNLEAFPRLLTLRLTCGIPESTLCSPLQFSNLASISFVDLTHVGQFGRTALDRFMLDLLLQPYLCPRLHTIRAGKYPNWALAAAMFHRRNSFQNVTSINSLWLHAYPETNILRPITRAIVAVDDDAQVVISATVEIKWLKSVRRGITSCSMCIVSGYTVCGSRIALSTKWDIPDDPTKHVDLTPPAVWAKRLVAFTRDVWVAYLQETTVSSRLLSIKTCHRHDLTNLVHIGPHTLTGVTYDSR